MFPWRSCSISVGTACHCWVSLKWLEKGGVVKAVLQGYSCLLKKKIPGISALFPFFFYIVWIWLVILLSLGPKHLWIGGRMEETIPISFGCNPHNWLIFSWQHHCGRDLYVKMYIIGDLNDLKWEFKKKNQNFINIQRLYFFLRI